MKLKWLHDKILAAASISEGAELLNRVQSCWQLDRVISMPSGTDGINAFCFLIAATPVVKSQPVWVTRWFDVQIWTLVERISVPSLTVIYHTDKIRGRDASYDKYDGPGSKWQKMTNNISRNLCKAMHWVGKASKSSEAKVALCVGKAAIGKELIQQE